MPFKIKYGDTDSIFVAIPGVTNQQLCVLCEDLAERINDLLPKTFKPDGSGELAGLIIEFEKWYDRLLLYKKKKYIGAKMEPDAVKPKLDMTGISAVRRDNFPIQVKTVSTVLNILMEPGPSIEVRSDRFRVSDGVVVLGRWASRQYLRDRVCALSDVCVDSVLFQVDETVPYAWATLEGSSTEIALERAKGKISDLIVDTVTKMYAGEFLVDQYAVSKSIKSPHLYANRDGMPHLHVMRRAIRDHPDYAPMVSHRHPFVFVTELCNAEMAKGRRQNNIPKGAYLESAPIAALTGKKPRLEHYTEYLSNNIAKVIFPLFTRTSENLKVRASGGLRARAHFRRFANAHSLPAKVAQGKMVYGREKTTAMAPGETRAQSFLAEQIRRVVRREASLPEETPLGKMFGAKRKITAPDTSTLRDYARVSDTCKACFMRGQDGDIEDVGNQLPACRNIDCSTWYERTVLERELFPKKK